MSKNTGTSELINYFDLGANGDVGIAGSLDINTILQATTDTDKFLVSDTGIIKFRTGAEILADIGGQVAGNFVTLDTAQSITAQKTFSTSGSAETMLISHGSGSGIALNISKAGNGEGLRVAKSSGSGNAVTITGGVLQAEAGIFSGDVQSSTRLAATNGSQQMILTPNVGGSVNRFEALGGLPLALITTGASLTLAAGGTTPQFTLSSAGLVTLTGALNGTSAVFSGNVGIGTSSSASERLHLANSTNGFVGLRLEGTGTYAGSDWTIYASSVSPSSADDFLGFFNNSATDGATADYKFRLFKTGAATFSSSVFAGGSVLSSPSGADTIIGAFGGQDCSLILQDANQLWELYVNDDFYINRGSTNVLTALRSNGNVGIGTATPIAQLQIGNFSNAFADIQLASTTSGYSSILFGDGATGIDSYRGYIQYQHGGDYMIFATASTERMRITSGGDVLVGTNITPSGSVGGAGFIRESNSRSTFFMASTTTGVATLVVMRNPNGDVGTIVTNGSSTSYNTSSDYRLKENVKPVDNALSVLTLLKPCTFNFIADSQEEIMGFIAHEVQEVMPQAVSGEKDAFKIEEVEVSPAELDEEGNIIIEAVIEEKEVPVYQGIDHSKLVPLLVAAIQELKTEIDSLKNV